MQQQPNQSQEAERLRAAANDESLSTEQRDIAAKLLAELEKPKPSTPLAILAEVFAGIDAKVAAERADQLARFKVCSSCCLKQSKDAETCELCGAVGKWESPLPASLERCHQIGAHEDSSEYLNERIARDSNHARTKHFARILELRGVPRVRSFWEKAGFTFDGKPRTNTPEPRPTSQSLYSSVHAARYE